MLGPTGGLALLALWPFVCILLVNLLPLRSAVLWSIFGGFLLLPVGISIDLPALPALDKVASPAIGVFAALFLIGKRPHAPGIRSGLIAFLIILMLVQPALTALTNGERSWSGAYTKEGLTYYDAISSSLRHAILLLPFLIGYRVLGSEEGNRRFIWTIFVAGLAYSLLALVELRLSPQLHRWVYGYFPHSWIQMLRDGGYRPLIFLPHALWVAFFFMAASVSALILWRAAGRERPRGVYLLAAVYLLAVLVMCKSLGSMMFAAVLAPLVVLVSPRMQVRVAAALAVVAMLYPALRGADLAPVDSVIRFAATIEQDRANSLEFRVMNEDLLLARANEKPFFGWGGRGRNLVFDDRGEKLTIIDGYWTVVIGQHGWVGYIAQFGLLGMPILLLYRRVRRGFDPGPVSAGLALLLAVNMIELLPNATLTTWTWMMAGALLGRLEQREESAPQAAPIRAGPKRPRTVL